LWRRSTNGSGDSSEARRLRQQRSRLLRAVQPIEPPSADADPYELAHEALIALSGVHAGVLHSPSLTEKVELASERIRQLAVGPPA
jgi:hypothetical protein